MGCGSSKIDEKEEKKEISPGILTSSKSLCTIQTSKKSCSGFLLQILKESKDFFCLISTEENITKDMIENKEKITFYYNDESESKSISLNSKERFIKIFKDIGINSTVVEILPEDNIEKEYFLLPKIIQDNNYKDMKNEKIIIINYQSGKLNYSNGIIQDIKENEFTHSIGSKMYSSGNPILLQNNYKVIGIQKNSQMNKADFIFPIFNFVKNIKENNKLNTEAKTEAKTEAVTKEKNINCSNKEKSVNKPEKKENSPEDKKQRIDYENGNYYIGEVFCGMRQGKGIQYYEDGDILYEGDFVNDEPEGHGKMYYESGQYYIGQFKNSLRHGKGTHYYDNGEIMYEGDYVNDLPEGNGKLVMDNGNYYIGQFKKGMRHGKGKSYNKNGDIAYEGELKNDVPNGKGILYLDNGNKYEGDFVEGNFEGNGKYYFEDGSHYEGQFKNGNMNGKGTFYNIAGEIEYEGDVVDGKYEGKGKLYYDDGSYYVGEFKNDLQHGQGQEFDKDGNILNDCVIYKEGNKMWNIEGGMEEGDFQVEE